MSTKELPIVTVVICTYDRPKEIVETVVALKSFLNYPKDKLRWLVADDGSPKGYIRGLKKEPLFEGFQFTSTVQRGGWGVNVNHGLSKVADDSPYVFFIEDDYVAKRVVNLDVAVAMLEAQPHVGMLRFRGTAGSHLLYHQLEIDVNDWVEGYQEGLGLVGKATFFLIDSGSPELWIYSNGPHLKRKTFHEFYGPYPEGLALGATEEAYAHHVKNRMKDPGAPCIIIQPEWIPMWWDHIGQSYQFSELDNIGKREESTSEGTA